MQSSGSSNVLSMTTFALALAPLVLGCTGGDDESESEVIVLKGGISVTGRFSTEGAQSIWGTNAVVNWVNTVHGGVDVGGQKRPLQYHYDDDQSDATVTAEIAAQHCADDAVHFVHGNYSTGLSIAAAEVIDPCGKLYVIFGGASETIFEKGFENVVQVISPARYYHRGIFDAVAAANGAGTSLNVAFLYEDGGFAKSVGAGAKDYALSLGHQVVFDELYPIGADKETQELVDLVDQLGQSNADIVVGGGHAVDSRAVNELMGGSGIAPVALSLLIAPGLDDYYDLIAPCSVDCVHAEHPAEGVCAPGQWANGVQYSEASATAEGVAWFGPSQEEFLSAFSDVAGADVQPSYQAAQAAAAVLALAYAIETADTTESNAVQAAFDGLKFKTFFGDFEVDATGKQVAHKMVEVQWQNGEKKIVWPADAATASFVYPMP